jgi:hypothetical protein
MDQVLKQTSARMQRNETGDHSGTFAYADDVGLVACSAEELQVTLDVWMAVLADNGLKLNTEKSEIMVVSRTPEELHITAGQKQLKQVGSFKYLGVLFDNSAVKETAINDRICQYSRNVGFLYPLLKDKHVPRDTKIVIYQTILRPILLYGCEAWTLTTAMKSKVQAAEMRVLRLIKGVTRKNRMRNDDIRKELGVKNILQYIEETQLRWFGHVKRMTDNRLPKQWLEWKPNTSRPRGRPRKRWMDNIKEAVEGRGSTLDEIERLELYLERAQWRDFFADRL